MGKHRRRKILMWIFGIILGVSGTGSVIMYVLTYSFLQNPSAEFPPLMLPMSILGVVFVVTAFVLIGLVLTMKKRL